MSTAIVPRFSEFSSDVREARARLAALPEPLESLTVLDPLRSHAGQQPDKIAVRALQSTAPGEVGTLVVGGPGVFAGYTEARLTAGKFVVDPVDRSTGVGGPSTVTGGVDPTGTLTATVESAGHLTPESRARLRLLLDQLGLTARNA